MNVRELKNALVMADAHLKDVIAPMREADGGLCVEYIEGRFFPLYKIANMLCFDQCLGTKGFESSGQQSAECPFPDCAVNILHTEARVYYEKYKRLREMIQGIIDAEEDGGKDLLH